MARLLDDALTEYLEIDQAVLSGTPLALTCRFNTNDLGSHQTLMCLANKDDDANRFDLILYATGDLLRATKEDVGGSAIAYTTSSYLANTWHHGCSIFASATDMRVLIDGGSKGTDPTDRTPTDLDRTSIGRYGGASPILYISGMIAEVAIWDLTNWPGATDSDKADNFEKILPSLTEGFSPLFYPLGLKAYWPLVRGLNDKVGDYNLTANGTVVTAHPRIILPNSPL